MMQEETQITVEEQPTNTVPWSQRDVWFGVGSLFIYFLIIFGIGLLSAKLELNFDIGIFLIFSELLLLVPVWFFGVRKYNTGWNEVGYRKFAPVFLLLGIGLMAAYYMFNCFFSIVILLPLGKSIQGDLFAELAKIDWSVWLWIGGAVAAPIAEEGFFRGFIFGGLKDHMNWKWAAAISSALFAMMHLQLTTIPSTFVMGFAFAYLYHKSKSIWPGIIIHALNNAVAFMALALLMKMELL